MVNVKNHRRQRKFKPSIAEKLAWDALIDPRKQCEHLWKKAMYADAALEKLCLDEHHEFKYDPIAMIMACISDMKKFERMDDPVWQASYKAAKTQLAFNRRIRRISQQHNIPILLIRHYCDKIDPKEVLGQDAPRY